MELSLPEVLQDPQGKVTVGWGLALVSLTRMVCTLQGGVGVLWHTMRTRALSWKKEMSPQCQVHKLCESIPTFTQNLLNLGVLLLYQKSAKWCLGHLNCAENGPAPIREGVAALTHPVSKYSHTSKDIWRILIFGGLS